MTTSQIVTVMPCTKSHSAITAIEPVLRDENAVIRELAGITYKLFKKVSHKLTSSNVKQSFRRLFKFIYIKKLKLLYNYNCPKKLTDSPMKNKETKNDNEGLEYENSEDSLRKNETLSSVLEYNLEEE